MMTLRSKFLSASTFRPFGTRTSTKPSVLRPIHFEHDESNENTPNCPFRIVGIRDVEVSDPDYPNRLDSLKGKQVHAIRNTYDKKNFISIYVDRLDSVREYLDNLCVPFTQVKLDSINATDALDAITIAAEKAQENEQLKFSLCGSPAFVEILQATPERIKEFEDDQLSPEDIAPDVSDPEPYKFKAKFVPIE